MTRALPRVHAVTDDQVAQLPTLADLAQVIAAAGAVAVHLRAPGRSGAALLALGRLLRDRTRGTKSVLFVNDRADIARICGASGVHLPEQGLPVAAARGIVAPGVAVGRSVHSPEDARRAAQEGADYVFLGPIWETISHPRRVPLGPEAIAAAAPARVIAIGGVTPERARICRDAGAYGVAAISALWRAANPAAAAQAMLLSFGSDDQRHG